MTQCCDRLICARAKVALPHCACAGAGPSFMDMDTQPMDLPVAEERIGVKREPADSREQHDDDSQLADDSIPPRIKAEPGGCCSHTCARTFLQQLDTWTECVRPCCICDITLPQAARTIARCPIHRTAALRFNNSLQTCIYARCCSTGAAPAGQPKARQRPLKMGRRPGA